MDPIEANLNNEPIAKRQRPNEEIAAANASNEEQTADIFNLDFDCFEELFDFLPINDLISISKTCKQLQQVAGYCYQRNYLAGVHRIELKDFRFSFEFRDEVVTHFAPFIQKIEIGSGDFEFFQNIQSKCHQLKQIELIRMKMTATDVNCLRETLSKLEVLRVVRCKLNANNQHIIDLCPKLKRLKIEQCDNEHSWLNGTYPTVEYFKLYPKENESDARIAMFLNRNSNIRKFATSADCLWKNRVSLKTVNTKLDELAIKMKDEELVWFCRLFNKLHERGFYKRLQLYFDDEVMDQECVDQLATINGLVKLHISLVWSYPNRIALSSLKSLEEIYVGCANEISDLDAVANDCINLKLIHFIVVSIDDILPFIKRARALQKIGIRCLFRNFYSNSRHTDIIDLKALNREREQLPNAHKITLYVVEDVYLATKWAMKETDLGLIRLKRMQSFEWNCDFHSIHGC